MHWDSIFGVLFLAQNIVGYIAKLLLKIQNTSFYGCDLIMLIELLWLKLELSKFEKLELACQDCHIYLTTLLPLAASVKMHLKCCLHDVMIVAW